MTNPKTTPFVNSKLLRLGLLCALTGCVPVEGGLSDSGTSDARVDTTQDASADSGQARSVEEFFVAMYAAQRDWATRCYAELFFAGAAFNLADLDDVTLSVVARKVAEGRIRYDAVLGEQCLSALAGSCDVVRDLESGGVLPVCRQAVTGLSAPGATCEADLECATGVCDVSAGQCPGVCATQVGEGGRCQADAMCSDGLVCVVGTCSVPRAEGEACDSFGFPARAQCATGLTCMDVSSTEGSTCARVAATAAQGDVCLSNGLLCRDNLSCVLGSNGQSTCQPRFGANQSCFVGIPNSCPRGYACDGICRAIPAANEPCLYPGSSFPRCSAGLRCVEGMCRQPLELGQACTRDECRNASCINNVCAVGPLFCT